MNPGAVTPRLFVQQPWLRVADKDRDDVVQVLQEAYADGRLDDAELDRRVDLALSARTAGDLQMPLRDLLPVQVARPAPTRVLPSTGERVAAMIVHWAGYFTFFLVPLIVYLVEGRRQSYLREQAAQAANFQLTFLLANIALGVASVLIVPALLFPVIWVGWFLMVFVGGVAGAAGSRFRYPLTLRMLR